MILGSSREGLENVWCAWKIISFSPFRISIFGWITLDQLMIFGLMIPPSFPNRFWKFQLPKLYALHWDSPNGARCRIFQRQTRRPWRCSASWGIGRNRLALQTMAQTSWNFEITNVKIEVSLLLSSWLEFGGNKMQQMYVPLRTMIIALLIIINLRHRQEPPAGFKEWRCETGPSLFLSSGSPCCRRWYFLAHWHGAGWVSCEWIIAKCDRFQACNFSNGLATSRHAFSITCRSFAVSRASWLLCLDSSSLHFFPTKKTSSLVNSNEKSAVRQELACLRICNLSTCSLQPSSSAEETFTICFSIVACQNRHIHSASM